MKILHLVLIGTWYDMIESGEKPEEYRAITGYWIKRLAKCKGKNNHDRTGFWCKKANCMSCITRGDGFHAEYYTHVCFHRGYTKQTMLFALNEISVGVGNPKWGAPEEKVFILKLGERDNNSLIDK